MRFYLPGFLPGSLSRAHLRRGVMATLVLVTMASSASAQQLNNLLQQLGNAVGASRFGPPHPWQPAEPPPEIPPPPMPQPIQTGPQPMVGVADTAGPSFRCGRARSAAERLICRSALLSTLDRSVANAFAVARQALPPDRIPVLRAEQMSWLRQRNACGADEQCLADSMRTRVAQLSGRSTASGAPPSMANGRGEFDAPPVTRLALLKLLMASRPDLFRNDVVPLLYRALIDRWGSPNCVRDMAAVHNELRLDPFIAESRTWTEGQIAAATASPTVRFRVDDPVALGPYNEIMGGFDIPPQQSQGSVLNAEAVVPYGDAVVATDSERDACPINTPSSLISKAVELNVRRTMYPVLHIHGGETVTTLPMPRPVASAWLDTWGVRSPEIRVETVVEASGEAARLVGRVVAARAVDPNTGAVLHVYDPSLFGGPSLAAPSAPQVPAEREPQPATDAAATSQAGVTSLSGEGVPKADFETLFNLLLAARPDIGKRDGAVLFWRAVQITWGTPECEDFQRLTRNEIKRRDLAAQLRPLMERTLDTVRAGGPTRSLTVSLPVLLGVPYDRRSQRFPLLDLTSTPAARRITVRPRPDWCSGIFPDDLPAHGVSFTIDDGGLLTSLPMMPAAATARLDLSPAREPRSVRIDAVVNVVASEQGLSARLVSAKAVDPRDEGLLHSYASKDAVATASDAAVPATRPVLAFEALRLDPGVLDGLGLLRMTKSQIQLDQHAYQSAGTGAHYANGRAHIFAFALNDVSGRNPDFVAPDLAPQMRNFLARIAATAPSRLYAGTTLGAPDYDHATSTLRLHCCYLRPGLAPGSFELLSPPPYFPSGVNLATNTPAPGAAGEIDRRAIYQLNLPKEPDPAPALDGKAAGLGLMGWEGPEIVALDRVLELDGVKLPPTEAEQVFNDVQSARSMPDAIYSRVEFTPEGLISAPGGRGSILLAHVEAAELVTPAGRVFARLSPTAFPLAADRAAGAIQQVRTDASEERATAQAMAAQKATQVQMRNMAAQNAAQSDAAAVRQAAASARSGTPYGPEIASLRLGMPVAAAEASGARLP